MATGASFVDPNYVENMIKYGTNQQPGKASRAIKANAKSLPPKHIPPKKLIDPAFKPVK